MLDLGWRKDRLNRWTTLTHDAVRNLVAVQDPLGRTTSYGYCSLRRVDLARRCRRERHRMDAGRAEAANGEDLRGWHQDAYMPTISLEGYHR